MTRFRWSLLAFVAGCVTRGPVSPASAPESEPPPPAPPQLTPPPRLPAPEGVYALDEAVRDALSGPLVYVGTGPWPGNHRVQACAYHNDRVIVVNVYCTLKEVKAFRVDVFSPARGRVRIYAEARVPVSQVARRDYFSFTGEAEPPPRRSTGLPPLALGMSFPELRDYDERRYQQFLPSCYGGVENHRRQGGCLRDLAPAARAWADRNRAFLEQPPEEWYRVIRDLRALASLHGKNVE